VLVLAFDTSSPVLTAAISDDNIIIDEINLWMPRGHMAQLLPLLDGLLKKHEYRINDVEAVVIGSGPGSYTGLRIGMVIARSLAQMLEAPIVGIPSLDAIAYRNITERALIAPIIDAKRGEVYTARYCSKAAHVMRLEDFKSANPEELVQLFVAEGYEHIVFAGDAVKLYAHVFSEILDGRVEFAPEENWWPRASDLIHLAWPRLERREYDELYQLAPIYVRLSQAEEMWEQRHRG
jgi:tRNA threonylcarbamoyladenosine biosynthesis protein TsaB